MSFQKFILGSIMCLLIQNIFAGEWKVKPTPDIILNSGIIIPQEKGDGKNDKVGISAGAMTNFLHVEGMKGSNFKQLQLLSVGIAMQEAGKFNFELSPMSIKTLSGLTYGFSIHKKDEEKRGGSIKLFLGISF